MPANNKVIARLTAIRAVGVRTIIDVHSDATFISFYHYYTQEGRRHSTKKLVRVANRNEGLKPWHRAYRMQPGLEVIAEHFSSMSNVTSTKIRILKKRAYRKLLEAAPDALGLSQVKRAWFDVPGPKPVLRYPVHIPQSHTTITKRMDIILGRSR